MQIGRITRFNENGPREGQEELLDASLDFDDSEVEGDAPLPNAPPAGGDKAEYLAYSSLGSIASAMSEEEESLTSPEEPASRATLKRLRTLREREEAPYAATGGALAAEPG